MSANILDGKQLAKKIRQAIAEEVKLLKTPPALTTIIIGNDIPSQKYIQQKMLAAKEVGINFQKIELPENTTEEKLLTLINDLNQDDSVNGILIQLPLPKPINTQTIIESVDPLKDVDGFHPLNFGLLIQRHPRFIPCTTYGILELIKQTETSLKGKNITVIGTSIITGLPTALALLAHDATVTICHEFTKNIVSFIQQADVLITAIGQPNYIQANWIKDGTIIIDVGINHLPNHKITGDVDFEKAKEKASWITPVPGGVGPMTVAMLLKNTLLAAKFQHSKIT